MKFSWLMAFGVTVAGAAQADVSILERHSREVKERAKRGGPVDQQAATRLGGTSTFLASVALTDGTGVRYFIQTNIGFATSSSASGAASDAAFTHAVAADTLNGGTVSATLTDAFDGYNALCLDLNNVGGLCTVGSMSVYNLNGASTLECGNRQVVQPVKAMGPFEVRRKVFVPATDGFARWLNIIHNTTGAPQVVRAVSSNNVGSDLLTTIFTTSDGDTTPELTDTWVTTFSNFNPTTSGDVRLGHVLRGPLAPVGLSAISFVNGDDNPTWRYVFTLEAGQTAILMNFVTGKGTRTAAATTSADLAALTNPGSALDCMSAAEIGQVVNFRASYVFADSFEIGTTGNWSHTSP